MRRQLPSPERTLELPFIDAIRFFMFASGLLLDAEELSSDAVMVRAEHAPQQLKALTTPDDDWRALRDDWIALISEELTWLPISPALDTYDRHRDQVARLMNRLVARRGREAEWRGLYPTLPKEAVRMPDDD